MSDTESDHSPSPPAPPPPPPPPPPLPEIMEKEVSFDSPSSGDASSPSLTTSGGGVTHFDDDGEGSEHDGNKGEGSELAVDHQSPPSRSRRDPYDNHALPTVSPARLPSRTPSPSPPPSVHDDDVDIIPESDDDDKPEMNGGAVNGGFRRTSNNAETGEKRYSLRIPVEDSHSQVEVDMDENPEDLKAFKKQHREKLFFKCTSEQKRIDYVLVFEDTTDEQKMKERTNYEDNLREEGLELEFHDKSNSVDDKSNFTLVHATWEALLTGAELMNMQKKLKMPKNLEDELHQCCDACCDPFSVGEPVILDEEDYFTSSFSRATIDTFDIDMRHKEDFFTNAERSLIVKEILDRTSFTGPNDTVTKIGIHKLIRHGCYKAAFPMHEGSHKPLPTEEGEEGQWEGHDKDRARLYESWARPGRWYCYQPLDLIRKYFGEKIGIYFAWLGFYTAMLIPATLFGLAAFIYGVVTIWDYQPVKDVCDQMGVGSAIMCPDCDQRCSYWRLSDSCLYSQLTYLFDNWATVAFAAFMSLWATVFLEFWKRKQKELEYDWDVANFELEERMRPEFETKVRHTKLNPITLADEPYVPWYESIPRQCISLCVILFFMCLVVGAIFSVILYRIVVVALLYAVEPNEAIAKLATSITASLINLILIVILNMLYRKVAMLLTELERPRTDTEFEDSFTFKMFLFQFVNFYGSIFYIAFFKGRFSEIPGLKRNYLFGKYRQDTCDPSGCLVDLFIQLAIIMVGKQMINNSKEILMPILVAFCRVKDNKKRETKENLYMRWEQDNDLPPAGDLGLFDEYLEMVIQYGFVTIFVAAFPLAPFFALLNNIIEIRLDAYKFCKAWRREPAMKAQDIGVWFGILQSITFIAILSNAFIIGWTSDFIPKAYYIFYISSNMTLTGYVEGSLSFFATRDFLNDTRPDDLKEQEFGTVDYCRFKGYLDDPRQPTSAVMYDYTKEYWHIFATRLAFVLVFEHTVFLLTWLVSVLIPDMPAHIKRLVLYERHLTKKMKFDAAFADKSRLKDLATNLLGRRDRRGRLEFGDDHAY